MLLERCTVIDLTQPLSPQAPSWNGSCGFCLEIKKDYDDLFRVQQIKMHAGIGTHMDAPSHRIEGAISIGDIPVSQFIAPACVLDVSKAAEADYRVSVQDVENYEAEHGRIPQGALVIAYTGWSRFWSDVDSYRNEDSSGQMRFPAFSASAAALLLTRGIAGIAIDTLSPDCLDEAFSVHRLILGSNRYIIENIADCSQMPPKGGYVIALPLRAENATESPMRIIGVFNSDDDRPKSFEQPDSIRK